MPSRMSFESITTFRFLFEFQPSPHRTTLETVKILAGMSRFVIADLTDARSVLQEVDFIVENLPSVAVRLLRKRSVRKHGMRDSDKLRLSVVESTYEYENLEEVIASIEENIIFPAEAKMHELRQLISPATFPGNAVRSGEIKG